MNAVNGAAIAILQSRRVKLDSHLQTMPTTTIPYNNHFSLLERIPEKNNDIS